VGVQTLDPDEGQPPTEGLRQVGERFQDRIPRVQDLHVRQAGRAPVEPGEAIDEPPGVHFPIVDGFPCA
jgi:hypothetical protein